MRYDAVDRNYYDAINNLSKRIYEHKNKTVKGFTEKYNLDKLVYFKETTDIEAAIKREKQLKNWHREWKINLVNEQNPEWVDLM